jgi:hypothetical protein
MPTLSPALKDYIDDLASPGKAYYLPTETGARFFIQVAGGYICRAWSEMSDGGYIQSDRMFYPTLPEGTVELPED